MAPVVAKNVLSNIDTHEHILLIDLRFSLNAIIRVVSSSISLLIVSSIQTGETDGHTRGVPYDDATY